MGGGDEAETAADVLAALGHDDERSAYVQAVPRPDAGQPVAGTPTRIRPPGGRQ